MLRDTLRTGTSECHRSIDQSMSRFDVTKRSDYGGMLTVHAMVFPAIEAWLERNGVQSDLSDWDERRRTDALLSDLKQLGRPVPEPLACSFDETQAGRAGVLYVAEGSRLGATLIVRKLREADRVLASGFLSHGAGGSLWRGFVGWLNDRNFSAAQAATSLQAARGVFDLYGQAMARLDAR